jgi:hypothetical protein
MRLLSLAGERCESFLAKTVQNVAATDVQCDEIWGFVQKKDNHKHGGEDNFSEVGNAWVLWESSATPNWCWLTIPASGQLAAPRDS